MKNRMATGLFQIIQIQWALKSLISIHMCGKKLVSKLISKIQIFQQEKDCVAIGKNLEKQDWKFCFISSFCLQETNSDQKH